MANEKIKRLPNGQWECVIDDNEKIVLEAANEEEAERMAAAYKRGDSAVRARVARKVTDKARSSLLKG